MRLNDIPLVTIDGASTSLAEYDGKVKLIVNVASRCGLAPQYEKLEALQKEYGDRGFTVLGFPSNQFLQELSSTDAIKGDVRPGDLVVVRGQLRITPGTKVQARDDAMMSDSDSATAPS